MGDCLHTLGSSLKIAEVVQILGLLVSTEKVMHQLGPKWFCYIFGDFFANSSGHPVCM
jgi:hypothetical protein